MVLHNDCSISFSKREVEVLVRVLHRLSLGYNIARAEIICSDVDIISLLSQPSRSFQFTLDSYECNYVEKLLRLLVRSYDDKK
nr:MAG TPA: hypothetical protein [Bacteriophage sp.]